MVSQPLSASLGRIAAIAKELGDLSAEVVFIGAAIAPLLQTKSVISRVRPTKDVDAVIASSSYSEYNALRERLIRLGFKEAAHAGSHVHKWSSPSGIPFDLVPAGGHLGGTGSKWDLLALETAIDAEINGVKIRHASAPGFLALKWAAFNDRGRDDPFRSQDLEDILALTASRESLNEELQAAPTAISEHVRGWFLWLLASEDYEDLIGAHLANAQEFKTASSTLRQRIDEIVNV
jgi:predicted nucleotidyltransferase